MRGPPNICTRADRHAPVTWAWPRWSVPAGLAEPGGENGRVLGYPGDGDRDALDFRYTLVERLQKRLAQFMGGRGGADPRLTAHLLADEGVEKRDRVFKRHQALQVGGLRALVHRSTLGRVRTLIKRGRA